MNVAVFGATGFVGGHVCTALERRGHSVQRLATPRLAVGERHTPDQATALAEMLAGCEAAVCAGGNPDASSTDDAMLVAANAAAPALISAASRAAGNMRLVYVSSAVVQGRRKQLDETDETDGFSAYARSKIAGEKAVREHGPTSTVVYRPPSVHAPTRNVTKLIARIATSPAAVVASPGTANSPQSLVSNVADAIAALATTAQAPPAVVIHPSEGITTSTLLELLGGVEPRRIPALAARTVTAATGLAGRRVSPIAANARRLEMILFGQDQATSWLSQNGWTPPDGLDAWKRLGETMRSNR